MSCVRPVPAGWANHPVVAAHRKRSQNRASIVHEAKSRQARCPVMLLMCPRVSPPVA